MPNREPAADDADLDAKKSKKKGCKGFMERLMKDKAMHKAFPTFWLVCTALSAFEYLTVIRPVGQQVAPVGSVLFEIGVPLSLFLFFWTALKDPGRLPHEPKGRSGMERLMRELDGGAPAGAPAPDVSRLCTTTWVLKGFRTKYCTNTKACVEEFDHYCVWLNCAIGRGNHRQFICLSVTEWATQIAILWVCFQSSFVLLEASSAGAWFLDLVAGHPLFLLVVLSHVPTLPWVTVLVRTHLGMVGNNVTTNEMMNYQRYDHFFVTVDGQKKFRNPFNKGGLWKNHCDFWWTRKRGQFRETLATPTCSKAGCSRC